MTQIETLLHKALDECGPYEKDGIGTINRIATFIENALDLINNDCPECGCVTSIIDGHRVCEVCEWRD